MFRILFIHANPPYRPRLSSDVELRNVEAALRERGWPAQELLTSLSAARISDLQRKLHESRPHVLHFACHGDVDGSLMLNSPGDDQSEPLTAEAMRQILRVYQEEAKEKVQLAVFAGCHTAHTARLVKDLVECAIGMEGEIDDGALAEVFSRALYQALALGYGQRSVNNAVESAQAALFSRDYKVESKLVKAYPPKGRDLTQVYLHAQAVPDGSARKDEDAPVSIGAATVAALAKFIQTSKILTEVGSFRADMEAASEQIETLAFFKNIHDLLHQLEFGCYQMILGIVNRFPDDETDLGNLASYLQTIENLKTTLDDLQKVAETRPEKDRWIRSVREAIESIQADLQKALDDRDRQPLDQAIGHFHRFLDRTPTRVNTQMNATARSLRLSQIEEHIAAIRDRAEQNVASSGLSQEQIAQFSRWAKQLGDLRSSLEAAIYEHDRWQEVDGELRYIDVSRLDMQMVAQTRDRVKELVAPLIAAGNEGWMESLRQKSLRMDESLSGGDAKKVYSSFLLYRRSASDRFFRVV